MLRAHERLQDDEIAVMRLRPHPVLFVRSVAWLAVALALLALAAVFGGTLWAVAAGLFLAASLVAAADTALRRSTTELIITDRRLLLTEGVLQQRLVEGFPAALAGLELRQSVLGRWLGYAWLRIGGMGDEMTWLPIERPDEVRTRIEALSLAFAPRARPAAEPALRGRLAVVEGAADRLRRSDSGAFPTASLRAQVDLDRF